jgi:hypothetical protein
MRLEELEAKIEQLGGLRWFTGSYEEIFARSDVYKANGRIMFTVTVNKKLQNSKSWWLEFIYLHELAHIFRGDLFTPEDIVLNLAEKYDFKPKIVLEVKNEAEDIIINTSLRSYIDQKAWNVINNPKSGFLTWEKFIQALPPDHKWKDLAVPVNLTSWEIAEEILSLLRKKRQSLEEFLKELGINPDTCGCIAHTLPEDIETLITLAEVQQVLSGVFATRNKTLPVNPHPVPVEHNTKLEQVVKKIIDMVQASDSTGPYQYYRTWSREGRSPLIRGVSRKPRSKILLAVDVSGSTADQTSLLNGLAKAFEGDVYIVLWDDQVRKVYRPGETYVPQYYGGGTNPECLQPIFETIQPQKAVIVSDGYCDAKMSWLKTPTVWVSFGDKPTGWGNRPYIEVKL